jgi:RHH-type proline utilization regulon transcriptional repressor/proline dehydrogenase/delta 1-pyrroline-5-carboxylate dehydrogenase
MQTDAVTDQSETTLDQTRHDIARDYHVNETTHLDALLAHLSIDSHKRHAIEDQATTLVHSVRANRKRFGGLDSFLNEYGLTTDEGIALMCLAEALLRIPDKETADLLIKDKIGTADWDEHIGKGSDLFVNASTWALMLTGKVIGPAEKDKDNFSPSNLLQKMVKTAGEPVVRSAMHHAMRILGHQFVIGRTIKEAMKTARPQEKLGYRYSYDMLGEAARTMADADRYYQAYHDAIDSIGKTVQSYDEKPSPITSAGISVKISALHPRYFATQQENCMPVLVERLTALARKCKKYNISMCIDAEEAHRLDLSLQIIEQVRMNPQLKGWEGFGLALQAYQKRAWKTIDWLAELSRQSGERLMIRLVKGAYWDTEIKYAQERGLPGYPVFTRKHSTDVSYLACARKMLDMRDLFYPQFATHNAHTVAAVMTMAGDNQTGFEFQRLHGMGEPLYHQMIGAEGTPGKFPVRVYAPVGSHEDLLPYLVRRLLENGANSSFVNRIQDDRVPVSDMVIDPIRYIERLKNKEHPKIPLPRDLYGKTRKNAKGIELFNNAVAAPLQQDLLSYRDTNWHAGPENSADTETIINPAINSEQVGTVGVPTPADIETALATAHDSFYDWTRTPAQDRAACLLKLADLMEDQLTELMALCIREAGKTIADALADVREAIDFCRYYALQGQKDFGSDIVLPGPTGEMNTLGLTGRGTFLCISPWNFPIAIFTGQVVAALMAGNCVIAKPAEQTPLIAQKVINLLYKAGIPENVLHMLPLSGEMTGKYLVSDPRITGVTFTGSTETARIINTALAARPGPIAPLIAETGGQNAMIVDNSALAEQVIDDMIISGFQSAGQRCSALRILYAQEGIADKIVEMLAGAAEDVVVGDPMYLSTDIGPVIDRKAQQMLQDHADKMDQAAKLVARTPLDADIAERGTYFAPRAYLMDNTDMLEREVFGPIIHIVPYQTGHLDKVMDDINTKGYGLTLGIHSRIDHTVDYILTRARVGNCYVNRSMIGAVVGVQPFGGMGLSGTGPKAGGPHYLHRFATEKTTTVNTTASGGNTTLVSLTEDDL